MSYSPGVVFGLPAKKYLHVSFAWGGVPKSKELEPVFDSADAWMRYTRDCWIVYTTENAQDWYNRLVPHITTADRMLICELNVSNKYGWLDKWMWEWFNKTR